MTNKQINIAIAEACGWDSDDVARGYTLCQFSEIVPDYCNDLNAMHEAERTMGDPQLWVEYQSYLSDAMEHVGWIYHAPARLRAEAFLKTIGKWEGGSQ
jgi:hypothetical protein